MNNNLIPDENETSVENVTEVSPIDLQEEEEAKKTKQRKVGWLVRDIFEWGETLVSAVVIIVIVFTFGVRLTSVDGGSMNPTLHNGDQMVVSSFFYTPKHNDIVVIYAPNLECCKRNAPNYCNRNCKNRGGVGKDIIKRVIGVEGDIIEIETESDGNGIVYRNGVPLDIQIVDNKLYEDGHFIEGKISRYPNGTTFARSNGKLRQTIPKGYVFVLGDNRGNSVDSRYTEDSFGGQVVGLVDVNYIGGRAFFRLTGFQEKQKDGVTVVGWGDDWPGFWGVFGFVK